MHINSRFDGHNETISSIISHTAYSWVTQTSRDKFTQKKLKSFTIFQALINGSSYPGNVSQVKQVVYLGWRRKHFSDDGIVDVDGRLKEKHNQVNIVTQ